MTVSHASRHRPASPPSSGGMWRATMSGFSASLVGIGLARFAYTLLLPAIVGAHWFAPSTAAYLGAANLAGYLAGAVLARQAERTPVSGGKQSSHRAPSTKRRCRSTLPLGHLLQLVRVGF